MNHLKNISKIINYIVPSKENFDFSRDTLITLKGIEYIAGSITTPAILIKIPFTYAAHKLLHSATGHSANYHQN